MNQTEDNVDVIETFEDTDTEEEKSLTTNVYNEIRLRLAKQGIPPEEIAFIHDARNPQQRAALFKAVNEGKIRVLIGSNEKMGTGLNVQERCVATHHITPPWRPGDLEICHSAVATTGPYLQLHTARTLRNAFNPPPRYGLHVPVTGFEWTACTGEPTREDGDEPDEVSA